MYKKVQKCNTTTSSFSKTPKKKVLESAPLSIYAFSFFFFAPCNVLVLNSYRLFGSYSYFSAQFYRGENSIFLCLACYLENDSKLYHQQLCPFWAQNCLTKMVLFRKNVTMLTIINFVQSFSDPISLNILLSPRKQHHHHLYAGPDVDIAFNGSVTLANECSFRSDVRMYCKGPLQW